MRSNLKWCALLVFATVLFYWKLFLTTQYSLLTGVESVNQTYSWLTFQIAFLRNGHLPVWDPFTYAGHSFIGEMQTAAFYPIHWLLALAPLDKFDFLSTNLFHALFGFNHVLAALFFFWLAREFGFDRFVSFLAAVCFSFGGFMARVGWPHMLESALWTPFLFAALLRAFRSQSLTSKAFFIALASLGLGLSILAGGLHIVIMQVILIVSAAAYFASVQRSALSAKAWLPLLMLVAAVIIGGTALGAVQLLPSHEYTERSIRFLAGTTWPAGKRIPYELVIQDQLFPQNFASVLFPLGFDGHATAGENWPPYIGVFPFAMVLLAIWRRWADRWVRYFTGLAIGSVLFAMASFTALHGLAYALVPFLWMAREATRFLFLTQFALCILMAFGLDALRTNGTSWPVARAIKWVALVAGASLAVPLVFARVELSPWMGLSLLLILLTCGFLWRLFLQPPTRAMWALTAAFVFFDLSSFNWIGRPNDEKSPNFEKTLESTKPACDFLRSRPGPFRVSVDVDPPPNIGDACRVPALLGGAVTYLKTYSDLRQSVELLNPVYRLKSADTKDPGDIYHDAKWKIYIDPIAYPRAWIVHQVAQQKAGLNPDLHTTAVLADPPAVPVQPQAPGDAGAINWRTFNGDQIELDAETRTAGLLVLSENFYPGWQATVNRKQSKILMVDGGLRAVAIPSGKSTVLMHYAAWSVRVGAFLSILAALTITAILVLFRTAARLLPEPVLAGDTRPRPAG